MQDIFIVDGARTASATFMGSFSDVSAVELGAVASKGALERSKVDPNLIDQVVIGNVIQSSKDAGYLARHVALKAGVPIDAPALTVNRLCGSGLQAVISIAQFLLLGDGSIGLAGGTENMTQAPYALRGGRAGFKYGTFPQLEDTLWDSLYDTYIDCGMAITAENLAEKFELTRQQIDEYALRSQTAARAAQKAGILAEEIVPVTIKDRKGNPIEVTQDEGIRDTTIESLAKLPARFKKGGVVTPGNASGINDAAASVIVATGDAVKEHSLKPIARILSWGIAGVPPEIMGFGPVPAIRQALKKADLTLDDMSRIEVNEAFASQYLAVEKELGLDRNKTNVNGGAISIGHPLGASGTRVLLTLAYELRRNNFKYGVASLCIGGGQGIAAVIENVAS
ncbi:MAG TPA: acetyl-CoA C-acetyltransferase [Ktedonobacteraceae bacterium]|nr:acetyl-CoA C-acetyltransferase [Ktedonobacteraceae bacterium]